MTSITRGLLIATLVALWAGCGSNTKTEGDARVDADALDADASDLTTEEPSEVVEDTPDDPPGDVVADPLEDAGDVVTDTVTDLPDDAVDMASESAGPCGNGTLDSGETCDDSNTVTEPCDTTSTTACLSDCSMVIVDCGNGTLDAGEACDDGDTDSMDDCTTSCTVNDRHIGAPCTCTGYECDRLTPWAGTVVGCTNVASHADSTRTLACLRSARETTAGVEIYFAEGYCSLVAVGCVSMISDACDAIPQTGDVSSFTCPTGYEEMTEARSAAGGLITVTTKSCHVICTSDADCRWKAEEETGSPWYGSCGEYRCVPRGDTGAHICVDEQNFPP